MRKIHLLMLLSAIAMISYKAEAIGVHTGTDVYKQLSEAEMFSQYVINLSDEQYSSDDSGNAHYQIMITELDAPDKTAVADKYNVWACPYNVYNNKNGQETSSPTRSTAWILTKVRANTSGDGASDYYTVQSASSLRYMPNKKLDGYSWLHTMDADYARTHLGEFLYQIEVVDGDTDPENPSVRLYNNETGTKMYLAESDNISSGWGSNPITFSNQTSFGSKIKLEFPSEEVQNDVVQHYEENGVTTGIGEVKAAHEEVPECRKGIYDIYGRNVENPVAGTFYIVDGKKVVYRD